MKVGVIIGRFQIDELHPGHIDLINRAISSSDQVLILVGSTGKPPSHNNPLSFEQRRGMIVDAFKGRNISILPFPDHRSDIQWVKNLDHLINAMFRNDQVTLFIGRQSGMGGVYKLCGGVYPIATIHPVGSYSSTDRRNRIALLRHAPFDNQSIIWATQNQYPKVYPTVDCVLIDNGGNVVLIRKKDESGWRFPGGFVDPSDASFEMACRREVTEECGVEITPPMYVASMKVDDWRYRGELDKIITTVFAANVLFGRLTAGDDAAELLGFVRNNVSDSLVPEHRPLWTAYCDWVNGVKR